MGDFRLRLLEELQVGHPWFASAGKAVEWSRRRRAIFFDKVQFVGNKLRVSLRSDEVDIQLPLLVRIHRPAKQKLAKDDLSIRMRDYIDIPWNVEKEIEISI